MNFVFDEVVCALEQFGGNDDDGGCSIADFLVLLLGQFDQDLCSGVLDFDHFQDGRPVI